MPESGFSPVILFLAAFIISFVTSMGGVSGAFLLLPFQVSILGFESPAVSSTNQVFNILAIPAGVLRYIREGRLLWPLALVIICGSLPGVIGGAAVRVWVLSDPGEFRVYVGIILGSLGIRMLYRLMRGYRIRKVTRKNLPDDKGGAEAVPGRIHIRSAGLAKVCYSFEGNEYQFSTPGVFLLAMAAGVLGGVYGTGGGALTAPLLVSLFSLPAYTTAGAVLLGTFVTSVGGVLSFQTFALLAPTIPVAPNWELGAIMGLGGIAGIYAGARCQRYVPAILIEWMLCLLLLSIATMYLFPLVS